MVEVIAAPTDGSWFKTSSIFDDPESFTSWSETTVTGAADSRFGCGMREPVTMMSCPPWTFSPSDETDGVGAASTGPVGCEAAGSADWMSCAHAGDASDASPDAPMSKLDARRFLRRLDLIITPIAFRSPPACLTSLRQMQTVR